MARINSNVGAITAQRNLNSSYSKLNSTLTRLSTGLRITRGADDPAGLIISEQLRSEISATNQAIKNTQRASNMIATAEGALDEIANLLRSMQEKIVEAANTGAMSDEEIEANQLQIDSAVASITRIANTTTFGGRNLIDGSLEYATSGVSSDITGLDIQSVLFGSRTAIPVEVNVTTSAEPGKLVLPDSATPLLENYTVEIKGNVGSATLSLPLSAEDSAVVDAINNISDATGVVARMSGNDLLIESEHLGTKQFVSVKKLPGSNQLPLDNKDLVDQDGETVKMVGIDAVATINGALCLGDGNNLSIKNASLQMDVDLDESFTKGVTSFTVTGGGALFQIGPRVNSNLQIGVGIQSMAATRLGNGAIGYLSQIVTGQDFSLVAGKAADASNIVTEAIRQVSIQRGRLGAFEKNTLDTNINQLGITMENLTASESTIRDADFAYETSQLSRNQVLVQSGTQVLGLANQTPQSVLQLLG